MKKNTIPGLFLGFAFFVMVEVARVYFIMPMPGSQRWNTIDLAYFLGRNIQWFRLLALVLVFFPALTAMRQGDKKSLWTLAAGLLVSAVVFYLFNFQLEADKMFYQPSKTVFASKEKNKIASDKLVLGVVVQGRAKAYPIQLIGYHHQVRDTLMGQPLMVTYCTVCRTGRVFSPQTGGRFDRFRLVGMDHFNALFEDATTHSWWQQATGKAIAGPLKGSSLPEIPSQQMRLSAWLSLYPNSTILQPDSAFAEQYQKMDKYDKGLGASDLTRRDSGTWKNKSWVVGVQAQGQQKAFDWNLLQANRLVQDSLPAVPILVWLENDSVSFHAFRRDLDQQVFQFKLGTAPNTLEDLQTGSVWNTAGQATSGPLKGQKLRAVRAYQEFWHSWKTFHP